MQKNFKIEAINALAIKGYFFQEMLKLFTTKIVSKITLQTWKETGLIRIAIVNFFEI